MPNPRVSVIIPVYNTEEHLEQCLDSVLAQTLTDIEVICIDDGSTDGSPAIVQHYVSRDPRVVPLTSSSTTRGPGAARNLGIARATGEYLAFVDSDDHIDSRMLESLHAVATNDSCDVVMCTTAYFNDAVDETYSDCTYARHVLPLVGTEAFHWRDLTGVLHQLRFVVWNKIYHRDLIDQYQIRFDEDMFYEDLTFSYKTFVHARRMRLIAEPFYHYRRGRPDATTVVRDDRVHDAIKALQQLILLTDADPDLEPLGDSMAVLRYKTLLRLLYRNGAEYIESSYRSLRDAAADTRLAHTSLLAPEDHIKRARIQQSTCVEFLSWAYWNAQTENHRLKRRVKSLKRSRSNVKRANKELTTRNKQLERRLRIMRRLAGPVLRFYRAIKPSNFPADTVETPEEPRQSTSPAPTAPQPDPVAPP